MADPLLASLLRVSLDLTRTEARILAALYEAPGSRPWRAGRELNASADTVSTLVSHIRRKIGPECVAGHTRLGYRLTETGRRAVRESLEGIFDFLQHWLVRR